MHAVVWEDYDEEKFTYVLGKIEIVQPRKVDTEGYVTTCVIHFPKHNIYIKITGEWDSYENSSNFYMDWADEYSVKQVIPKAVTVT